MTSKMTCILVLLLLSACGSSKQFDAVPSGIDVQNAPKDTLSMSAVSYTFTPEVVRVKAGTLVTLKITATGGIHGFELSAFGIDERLDENVPKLISFYVQTRGEYGFRCSHFCGLGHLGMSGKIIVE